MPIDNALLTLIAELEQDSSLHEPCHLRQRFAALDRFDALLSDGLPMASPVRQRAHAIAAQLESVNSRLYDSIRHDIQHGTGTARLLEWTTDGNAPANLINRSGYDYLDELLSGVLHFEEPSAEAVPLDSEMVAYQPTPARHIFNLLRQTGLTERDSLIDLGSGLGHVTLLAAICTGATCIGIELEASYIECARKCAHSLNLNNVTFIHSDVRSADLSGGNVFYLYTPFIGAILRDVLSALRLQALTREIRICTFGPCTPALAQEQWLTANGSLEADRIALFRSRD